jgi:hypothetical protein
MDHIPSELIPLLCTIYDAPALFLPPVTALLDAGFPLTGTQPLPILHMPIVAKAKMEVPPGLVW